jgi:hypothetical protein
MTTFRMYQRGKRNSRSLHFASVGMTKGRAVLSVEFGKWLKGTRSERNLLGLRLFGVDCEDPALGYLLPDADC